MADQDAQALLWAQQPPQDSILQRALTALSMGLYRGPAERYATNTDQMMRRSQEIEQAHRAAQTGMQTPTVQSGANLQLGRDAYLQKQLPQEEANRALGFNQQRNAAASANTDLVNRYPTGTTVGEVPGVGPAMTQGVPTPAGEKPAESVWTPFEQKPGFSGLQTPSPEMVATNLTRPPDLPSESQIAHRAGGNGQVAQALSQPEQHIQMLQRAGIVVTPQIKRQVFGVQPTIQEQQADLEAKTKMLQTVAANLGLPKGEIDRALAYEVAGVKPPTGAANWATVYLKAKDEGKSDAEAAAIVAQARTAAGIGRQAIPQETRDYAGWSDDQLKAELRTLSRHPGKESDNSRYQIINEQNRRTGKPAPIHKKTSSAQGTAMTRAQIEEIKKVVGADQNAFIAEAQKRGLDPYAEVSE